MINVLLTGVGGQGTVLAAKVLAQAAQEKGWQVRTAETIGMAQRGGNVTSHVRMGNNGEEVLAPLLAHGTADLVIAFEPAEAARALPFLASGGTLVTATTPIQPVTTALSGKSYRVEDVLAYVREQVEGALSVACEQVEGAPAACKASSEALMASGTSASVSAFDGASAATSGSHGKFVAVDEGVVLDQLGNRKALNTVLLASALATGCIPLTLDDLRCAVRACVKPKFVDLNLRAIELAG